MDEVAATHRAYQEANIPHRNRWADIPSRSFSLVDVRLNIPATTYVKIYSNSYVLNPSMDGNILFST